MAKRMRKAALTTPIPRCWAVRARWHTWARTSPTAPKNSEHSATEAAYQDDPRPGSPAATIPAVIAAPPTSAVAMSRSAAEPNGVRRPTREAVRSSTRPSSSSRRVSRTPSRTPTVGKMICPMNPTSIAVIPPSVVSP